MTGEKSMRYFSPWMLLLTVSWAVVYFLFMPDALHVFAEHWPLIFVGIAGATIGNLTAIGGGLVFIPVLMFAYHLEPVSALKLAFVSQAFGMTSGATGWLARKEVPIQLLKWTIPSLILGTLISTFLIHPQPMMVKGLFGPIAALTGILTLVTLNSKGHQDTLPSKAMIPVFLASIVGGLITGWVAIGEGEIVAAFCMIAYGLSPNKSIGLGVILLSVNSILLACLHAFYFGNVPWEYAAFTMLGCLWGGRLGPYIGQWIPGKSVKKLFAWIAVLDGLLITWQVFRSYLH